MGAASSCQVLNRLETTQCGDESPSSDWPRIDTGQFSIWRFPVHCEKSNGLSGIVNRLFWFLIKLRNSASFNAQMLGPARVNALGNWRIAGSTGLDHTRMCFRSS